MLILQLQIFNPQIIEVLLMYRLNRVLRLVFLIYITSSLSGCLTVGTVEIEIIQPAKITIPSNINSVLIVNNSISYPSSSFKNKIQKGLYKLDSTSTQLLVRHVNEILNESPRFDTIKLIGDLYYRKSKDLLQPITWDGVNSLCSKYNVNALLSLEAFGINDTIIKYSYYDGFAYYSNSNLALVVNSMWRIYLNDEHRVLEKRVHRDTIYIDKISSKSEYFDVITQKRVVDYLANRIATGISTKVADRMAPYWQPIQRSFFIYSNQQMQQAAKFAYADNWREAAYIWKLLTTNENKKISAAACHNMALVCEVEGKLAIAVEWLEQSLEINDTFISRNYLDQIHLRIKKSAELDKQFGIN